MELGAGGAENPVEPFVVGLDGGARGGFLGEGVGKGGGLTELAGEFEAVAEKDVICWGFGVFVSGGVDLVFAKGDRYDGFSFFSRSFEDVGGEGSQERTGWIKQVIGVNDRVIHGI